jgi:hypothetical protein
MAQCIRLKKLDMNEFYLSNLSRCDKNLNKFNSYFGKYAEMAFYQNAKCLVIRLETKNKYDFFWHGEIQCKDTPPTPLKEGREMLDYALLFKNKQKPYFEVLDVFYCLEFARIKLMDKCISDKNHQYIADENDLEAVFMNLIKSCENLKEVTNLLKLRSTILYDQPLLEGIYRFDEKEKSLYKVFDFKNVYDFFSFETDEGLYTLGFMLKFNFLYN